MNEEIEKLKKERDEILAKVEELDRLTCDPEGGINWPQVHAIFEELKALKPKPERLRCWVNLYIDGSCICYASEVIANLVGDDLSLIARRAVPMIEVRPLPELPEMEEWDKERVTSEMKHSERSPFDDYRELVSRHNATVRAFKAYAEAVKKEVGDE